MTHKVKVLNTSWLTHDVLNLKIEKPASYSFTAGQAIEVTLDDKKFKGDMAPFTLTCLNTDAYLELIPKVYTEHRGMTLAFSKLKTGDNLIITDAWDSFKNNGPGVFLAGGTGITPFIAILRQLNVEGRAKGSTLYFSNKTVNDIFLYDELNNILGDDFINILTDQKNENFLFGRIDKNFLKKHINDFNQPFYACGPNNFAENMRDHLIELGVKNELINISY